MALTPIDLFTRPGRGIAALFTSMFAHAGIVHAAGNMYFLWIFGSNLEDLLGRTRYAVLYVLFGFLSALIYSIAGPDKTVPMLGASGAVSGILGGYLYLYPKIRVSVYTWWGPSFRVPAWVFLGIYFVGMQILGIVYKSQGVAWWAHLSGFLVGFATVPILKKADLL